MPKPYPVEFKNDVLAIARRGEQPVAQVARDFGVSEDCLRKWLKQDAGSSSGAGSGFSSAAEREYQRRIRVLEQQVEVFKKATAFFSQGVLPK